MNQAAAVAEDPDIALAKVMATEFYDDPYGFVCYAFPWNEGELEGFEGPDEWQADILHEIGKQVRARKFDGINPVDPIREAVASGHGVGKTAIVSWLILWIMSTRPMAKGVVTANTATQLETKTWAELAKWQRRCITGRWFRLSSAKGGMSLRHRDHPKEWRCDAITSEEKNSEAFAGLHNAGSTPFYIFDEGSAIADIIYEVAEGGLTDGEPMFFVFGNPTRNSGAFRACFGRFRDRWNPKQVDSRTAKMSNKKLIEGWIKDYGEDSDFVRIRVKGQFPRLSASQFISSELAARAADPEHDTPTSVYDHRVMGVDIARQGDDQTVIAFRVGRDARSWPWVKLRIPDTMQVAARVAEMIDKFKPDAVYLDMGGVGAGVYDRLAYLRYPVQGVDFGAAADRAIEESKAHFRNKRAEMWGVMREWLAHGIIPSGDTELIDDLTGVEYGFVPYNGHDCILLEKKEHMKSRGLASPDAADALALTFAYPVASSDHSGVLGKSRSTHKVDYDPFASSFKVR